MNIPHRLPCQKQTRIVLETLHTLGYCLAQPLSSLFTLFFNHGYVPPEWKVAFITPIHKKGAGTNPSNNYRPISNTSIMCRIMEQIIVHEQIAHYLQTNSLLCPAQHGFQSGNPESQISWSHQPTG